MNEGLEKFWRFAYERQSIWARREAGWPEPWTDDPILRKYRFTNVHRELDHGTKVLRRAVTDTDNPRWARVWNTMLYREFDRAELWEQQLKFVGSCTVEEVRARLKGWEGPMFTDAYMSSRSLDQVLAAVSTWPLGFSARLKSGAHSAQEAWALIRKTIKGKGDFKANQTMLDLAPEFGQWTDDEWVFTYRSSGKQPGGSGAGLQKLGLPTGVPGLVELRAKQSEHLKGLGLDWSRVAWEGHERLTIADLEHTLCEWVKYDRFAAGLATRARRFR